MASFRKRPIAVEAYQFDERVTNPPPLWLLQARGRGDAIFDRGPPPSLVIQTLEGEMTASLGDWIVKGVAGELYPVKPDIFAATYEPADV